MEQRLARLEAVRTLEDHAYASVRAAISSGALKPGERLSADALAKELGVSRMPIVQALRRLASEGFVTAAPHKPVTVATPGPSEIRERYLLIVALERPCATEAFQRDADGLISALRERLTEQRASDGTAAEEDRCDRAFHAALWEASGLPSVISLLEMLWDRGGYYRVLLFSHADHREARLVEHSAILAAAETKQLEAFLDSLEEHRWRGMARMQEIVATLPEPAAQWN